MIMNEILSYFILPGRLKSLHTITRFMKPLEEAASKLLALIILIISARHLQACLRFMLFTAGYERAIYHSPERRWEMMLGIQLTGILKQSDAFHRD